MGTMQNNLERMLVEAGMKPSGGRYRKLLLEDVRESGLYEEALNTYQALGGVQNTVPLGYGKWDMEFEGLIVELDEQRHFNRYRLITLESPIYSHLPKFPINQYKQYCIDYEPQCLRAGGFGGNWTNPSCERQFGKASEKKDLNGNGPSRWKQRAFYDYLKDLSVLILKIPIVRLSIWDEILIEGKTSLLKDVLGKQNALGILSLQKLIEVRRPG